MVRDRKTVAKLFERIAPRYAERPGGYTRIIKLGHRLGDNAPLSLITLVEEEYAPKAPKKAAKPAAEKKLPAVAPAAAPVAVETPVVDEASAVDAEPQPSRANSLWKRRRKSLQKCRREVVADEAEKGRLKQ